MILRRRVRRPAAAAVEFAVLAPLLAYFCIVGVDWARLFYLTICLDDCARNGALYASEPMNKLYSPYANTKAAALAAAPGVVSSSDTTVTEVAGTVLAGAKQISIVTVTVTKDFKTLTNFPGVPKTTTLNRAVQMRVNPLTST